MAEVKTVLSSPHCVAVELGEKACPMERGRVSVIIPTYNRAAMTVEAVESALAQSYPNVEVLVVDDGSVDDTEARLQKYGNRIVYQKQKNQGVAAARNTGIRAATGEFVAFLDSDDMWHPRKLEVQMEYMHRHPDVGIVSCQVHSVAPSVGDLDAPLPEIDNIEDRDVPFSSMVLSGSVATSGALLRKACLEKVGLFDPDLTVAEDRHLFIRIGAYFHVRVLDAGLAFNRSAPHDHLNDDPHVGHRYTRAMLDKVFQELPRLQNQPLLKRKALSITEYERAIMETHYRRHFSALCWMARSFWMWPLGINVRMASRWKAAIVMTLRLLRLRRS